MELKLRNYKLFFIGKVCSNRTFMELKCINPAFIDGASKF